MLRFRNRIYKKTFFWIYIKQASIIGHCECNLTQKIASFGLRNTKQYQLHLFTVYKVWKKEKRNVQATLLDSMTFSLNWIAVSKKIIGSNTHLWGAKAVQNEIVKKTYLKCCRKRLRIKSSISTFVKTKKKIIIKNICFTCS